MSNQQTSWGASLRLCSGTSGCLNPNAFTGLGTADLSPPTNGDTILTVNFGLMCTVPYDSSIDSYEAFILPNN